MVRRPNRIRTRLRRFRTRSDGCVTGGGPAPRTASAASKTPRCNWAPGWDRSRQAMTRMPGGRLVKVAGSHRVSSPTWAPSRGWPSASTAARQSNNCPDRGVSGMSRQSACAGTPFATVGLDGLHRDAGVHSGDGGISHQLGGEPVFVGREIGDLDPNDVLRNSEHAAYFGNRQARRDTRRDGDLFGGSA